MNKQASILLLFCLMSASLFSQKRKIQNQPYGDQRLYHFGLNVGFNMQDMILTNSGYTGETGETWYAGIPNYSPGFSVGMIADLYLNPFMNLRLNPTLHFGDRLYYFKEETLEEPHQAVIRSTNISIPLSIKFSAMRLNDCRPYLLTGVYASLDLGRKTGLEVLQKTLDYGFEIGLGCDFYLPIVKVCPEIKFCFGLANLIEKDRSDLTDKELLKYSQAISKGTSRMIVLTFNFE